MTRASELASSNLQTLQSGSLAFARWPQSNLPYSGLRTAARRGTVASTGGRDGADGKPGGGAGALCRATTGELAGAAAILVGSRADTVAVA
jgi:hypothetical protein